jgi:hypothetical protein
MFLSVICERGWLLIFLQGGVSSEELELLLELELGLLLELELELVLKSSAPSDNPSWKARPAFLRDPAIKLIFHQSGACLDDPRSPASWEHLPHF